MPSSRTPPCAWMRPLRQAECGPSGPSGIPACACPGYGHRIPTDKCKKLRQLRAVVEREGREEGEEGEGMEKRGRREGKREERSEIEQRRWVTGV